MLGHLKPGVIVMHPRQYNKLCGLMRVHLVRGRHETFWNGSPVVLDRDMPEAGWFAVPEEAASDVGIVQGVGAAEEGDD